jgi:hypothetical protein
MIKNEKDIAWDLIAKSRFFENEREMLVALYENASIPEVAAVLNTSTGTVLKRMEKHGIPRRRRGGIVNKTSVRYKMFHVDQRIILILGLSECSAAIGVSTASLYKYKQWKIGRLSEMSGNIIQEEEDESDAILHNQSGDGVATMGDQK